MKDALNNGKKKESYGDKKSPGKGKDKKSFQKKGAAGDGDKKVVKSSSKESVGAKPDFKKRPKSSEGSRDSAGKKKTFKPKDKPKKPITPEDRKKAKPHYKLVRGRTLPTSVCSLSGCT